MNTSPIGHLSIRRLLSVFQRPISKKPFAFRTGFSLLAFLLNMTLLALPTKALELVKEGNANAAIFLASEPDQAAQLAAYELQEHIRLITGAELPILTEGTEHSGPAIYVGDTKAARAEGLSPEKFKDQEYVVKVTDEAVFLVGKDAEDKTKVTYEAEKNVYNNLPGFWTPQGSLYAAYDFLEKEGGVRWLEPTRFGTYVPKSADLVVKEQDTRNKPSFVYRDILASSGDLVERYDGNTGYWPRNSPELESWRDEAHGDLREKFPDKAGFLTALRNRNRLHMLRLRNGGEMQRANHSLYSYYERYWDNPETRRPEFFAQGYGEGKPPQFCYTNPELIKQVAADAAKYYDTGETDIFWKPTLPNLFPVVPNDNKAYCKCPTCQELMNKPTGKEMYSNGRDSDYIFNFVNEVAKELHKTHPDKGVRTLAYMTYAAPPKRIKLDPGVAVQFCLPANRDDRPLGSYKHEMDLLDQWANDGSGRQLSMWLYNGFPKGIGAQRNLNAWPGVFSHLLADQMKHFHKDGVEGFFHCGTAEDVDQYLTMRYMFDVDQNVDETIDEYFTGLYGAAAEPVKEFYAVVEKRYAEVGSGLNEREVEPYTKEIISELEALLAKADTLAKTEREKGNLALLRLGIWRYLNEGMAQRAQIANTPIPSLNVPKISSADGDPSKVDWSKVSEISDWNEHNSLEPSPRKLSARIVHDDKYLYMELTDQCDPSELQALAAVFPNDTWEVFVGERRGIPFRHYAFNPGGNMKGLSNGEINFRMYVPMETVPMTVQSDLSGKDRWVARVAWPLKEMIEGGVKSPFYLNIARVAKGNHISIWGPLSALNEMQRAPELNLEK